ncbi:predicted protein [Botrytis cinerea T4]|uniref:Uncharacterized protein n=1 Tax=Botryotinia fuckeliana (strain T4) TaxID=999810 RepID=G2Y7G9_BOTF4|nr:predicted protein [Botrytis cinerea T4]
MTLGTLLVLQGGSTQQQYLIQQQRALGAWLLGHFGRQLQLKQEPQSDMNT